MGIMFFLILTQSINGYQTLYILSKNIYSVKNRTIWEDTECTFKYLLSNVIPP